MICSICESPLTGGIDTFGPHNWPLCAGCYYWESDCWRDAAVNSLVDQVDNLKDQLDDAENATRSVYVIESLLEDAQSELAKLTGNTP